MYARPRELVFNGSRVAYTSGKNVVTPLGWFWPSTQSNHAPLLPVVGKESDWAVR